jgi:hypothetical protein
MISSGIPLPFAVNSWKTRVNEKKKAPHISARGL